LSQTIRELFVVFRKSQVQFPVWKLDDLTEDCYSVLFNLAIDIQDRTSTVDDL